MKSVYSCRLFLILILFFNIILAQNTALDFDGSDDYITIADHNSLDVSSSITVSAWVYPTNIGNKDGIVSKRSETENAGDWAFRFNAAGKIKFVVWSGNANKEGETSNNAISTNTWTHVAFTHDNSNNFTKFYINGSLDETGYTIDQDFQNTTSNAYVGWDGQQGNTFSGRIDEVRIWDDVRTVAEIQNNMYTELVGNESNLVAYYKFNEATGTTVNDISSNSNYGTMTNMNASSDWTSASPLGTIISGNSGYRMLSSPVSGQIISNLLNNLWTQGMTGSDYSNGNANVWILNVSGQSWTALSDISGSGTSIAAGQGLLVYVFEDTDYDGSADLPATISVSGTGNSGSATYPASGSIAANAYGLAGNPYYSTIDWDNVTKTNVNSTAYVWDDATGAYKSWNGSSGGLTDGLIAPFQGFWVQANGSGSGSITVEAADISLSVSTLYRVSDIQESGSVVFDVSSSEFNDQTFISFQSEGESGLDNADGYKLFPLNHSDRLVAISYADDTALDINNLPYDHGEEILIPFDIMQLQLDGDMYVTQEEEVTFNWDVSNLPDHISLKLIDEITNIETDMDLVSSITFTTQPKGSFSTSYSGPVGTYPVVGEARFSLAVSYDALTSGGTIKVLPAEFALHAAYPNPFNPSTTISFDLPENRKVSLSIYDLKGALVRTLLNESKVAGAYQYKWTPHNELASGVYLFELKTKNKTKHQKITYIK